MTPNQIAQGYLPTKTQQHALVAACVLASRAAWTIGYATVMQTVQADADASDSPDLPSEQASTRTYASVVAGIVATLEGDLTSYVSVLLATDPSLVATLKRDGSLTALLASWLLTHMRWKIPQIVLATTSAALSDGTTSALDDVLSGTVGDTQGNPIDTTAYQLVVLPDTAAADDVCAEWAGRSVPLDAYDQLPDFPAHNGCPHTACIASV